jgi:DNA-binding LytR/AlgR family response regulator
LDPRRFWQVHRGLGVQARHIRAVQWEETGRVLLTLRRRWSQAARLAVVNERQGQLL